MENFSVVVFGFAFWFFSAIVLVQLEFFDSFLEMSGYTIGFGFGIFLTKSLIDRHKS